MDASALLRNITLMPVIMIEDASSAAPLAETLLAAGIGAVEVALCTDTALEAIEDIARKVPDILVGAESVRLTEQFAQIKSAGALFAVSPGATDELLAAANMAYLPGAATASECLQLLQKGYQLQKFFPAEANGGVRAIQAISAPLPEIKFCPTGGVNQDNLQDYLGLEAVACVGGSWFMPGEALRKRDFASIKRECLAAMRLTQCDG
jgi:2-dehydro-3-deoxyphosphogluconate aldolase/(4S)-4-hydroxy-2-oxoglutarate aldolase